MAKESKTAEIVDISVEEKLRALCNLQTVDSETDKIRVLRGELPLEVQDLEDEVVGLQTRINNIDKEVNEFDNFIKAKKNEIKEAEDLIKKYTEQQNNVRNNREYDSLTKEIEFQSLEIQLCEKRIKEYSAQMSEKKAIVDDKQVDLNERIADLNIKKSELDAIIADTKKEEEVLVKKSQEIEQFIEKRLLDAYKRIRKNARNGLAVVSIQRDACGGCFNKIPPQKQLEIRSRKKIIVCEYCGRIIVDKEIVNKTEESN